jgi:hypothetical protein
MPESPGHHNAVAFLVRAMRSRGMEPVAAAGGGGCGLPDPPAIGRHEPDALALDAHGWVIGEVKRGPELFHGHTQEQLYDFTRLVDPDGKPFRLLLVVPGNYRRTARAAVREARGSLDRLAIVSPLPRRAQSAQPRTVAGPNVRVQRSNSASNPDGPAREARWSPPYSS